MRNITIDVIGIQNQFNQCWFKSLRDAKPSAMLRRKKWTSHSNKDRLWTYAPVYGATRFESEMAARVVCDRLNAEMPQAEWEVVRYKEVKILTMKVLYAPKKGRR